MSKLKPSKAKKARHERYAKESRAAKNRDAALKRHLKTHEGDEVAKRALKRPAPSKGKSNGANLPAANREKCYVDAAGKPLGAPEFKPQMVFNRKTEKYELDRSIGADWFKANKGQTVKA